MHLCQPVVTHQCVADGQYQRFFHGRSSLKNASHWSWYEIIVWRDKISSRTARKYVSWKHNQQPHAQMMKSVHILALTQKGNDPAKQGIEKGAFTLTFAV